MAEESPEKLEVVCCTAPPVTDPEREFGHQAQIDFEKENYDACLKQLNKVLTTRPTDAKVHHNKALLEYCRGGFRKTDDFLKGLMDVCEMKQILFVQERLPARDSDVSVVDLARTLTSPEGTQCQVNLTNVNNLDDVDYCVIFYNHALLLYYTKEYHQALAILDKIFQFIEPLEETLRRKVLFLMVEVYLATQQPEKAHAILNFTEKTLFGNGTKSQQPTPEKDKERESRESRDTPPDTSSANEIWRPKISQYKVRCYLMLKSVKACKREIKNLMSAVGLGSQLVYLKSNFEYLRANYRKTIKLLNTSPKPHSEEEQLPMMYYNNLGCIHFHMQKHNLGAFYLKKAMIENDNACAAYAKQYTFNDGSGISDLRVTSLSMSRHNELLYNLGIQLLHCSKLEMAFDCLMQVINYYHTNPRLWLRVAECCIKTHKESNDEDRELSRRMEVVTTSVGSGLHRKLILGNGSVNKKSSDRNWPRKEQDSPSQYQKSDGPAVPALTLEFAILCLKNALVLLPDDKAQPPAQASANSSSGTGDEAEQSKLYDAPIPAPPANPIRGQEIVNLKSSILCHMAYVSLCLNDHLMAAKYAERLLQQPKLSGAHRYVGSMYLAEAYVALDRIADAVHHLVPDNVNDLSLSVPDANKQEQEKGQEQDQSESSICHENWAPRDVTKARAVMQYNLAMAHAVRGENEKALRNLAASANHMDQPFPAQIYYLMLYLDLVDGQRKRAQHVIKEQFGHLTPNRS